MRDQLELDLDPTRDAPLYRQVVDQIRARIRSGVLPAGYRLPPTRDLARHLKTHRNTVVRAYEELVASGHTVSTVGRGTFVAEPPAPKAAARTPARTPIPWHALVSDRVQSEPLRRAERLAHATPLRADTINLADYQPPAELLPVDQFRRCVDHVLRECGPRALAYVDGEGVPELRGEIAKHLTASGMRVDPDHVLITTGSQQALDLLARILVDPGDVFLVEGLSYPWLVHLLTIAGARVLGVKSDDDGPDLDELRRLTRREPKGFYLIPGYHNPTGANISTRRREALVAWSHETGVPLIEDDHDADLDLDGQPEPPRLRAMDPDVCHVGTFSKRLIPALRLGYVVCPPALRERAVAQKNLLDLGASALMQYALAEFLARGYLGTHVAKCRKEYRARRDELESALRAELPPEITWKHASRGLFLWIPLPAGVSAEAVHEEALRRGVLVRPSLLFRVSDREPTGLRVSFCRERGRRLAEGARRLGEAVRAVMKERPADRKSQGPRLGAT